MAGARPDAHGRFPPAPPWADELTTIAVTGTNGKTSTAWWCHAILQATEPPAVLVSTVGARCGTRPLQAIGSHAEMLALLERARGDGARSLALEVTSASLARGFAPAFPPHVAIFTNLSHDHLDQHGSFEHYLASKAQLFVHLRAGGVAVLGPDPSASLIAEIVPPGRQVWRCSAAWSDVGRGELHLAASWTDRETFCERVEIRCGAALVERGAPAESELIVPLPGRHFAENAALACLAAAATGIPFERAVCALREADAPAGRLQRISQRPLVVVDYAHTPDALMRTVAWALTFAPGRVQVVLGAGGRRDRGKRPAMARAVEGAARVILTEDNPRDEDPAQIFADLRAGLPAGARAEEIADRREAIAAAIDALADDDVLLICGRGHEHAQERADGVHALSDAELASAAVAKRRARSAQ